MLGPRHLQPDVAGVGPQSHDAVVSVEIKPHVDELLDGARREAIATSFLAGVFLLLGYDHRQAAARQPVPGGRTTGTTTNN